MYHWLYFVIGLLPMMKNPQESYSLTAFPAIWRPTTNNES